MAESMLSFVMHHLPCEWEDVGLYDKSYILVTITSKYSREYQRIEKHFYGSQISRIQRVQNPFQYGRYMLRREMLNTNYEEEVFHAVHRDDVETALKFNCDYRRYRRRDNIYQNGQHPQFYRSFSDILNKLNHSLTDMTVLILRILAREPITQCDYYIEYLVQF